jgi:hypothetical protein
MNLQEAALVLTKVQAYRPGVVVDDFTVSAWQEAFDDIRFEDGLLAVRNLGRVSSKFLDPAQIRTEVDRLLGERKRSSDSRVCYICGGTWEQCAKRHAYEVRNGVPDPHEYETAETAERNKRPEPAEIRHQLAHLLDKKNLRNDGVA